MGKREAVKKPKSPRDFYATVDPDAVKPLIAFLGDTLSYAEPCAGNGDLIDQLSSFGLQCDHASDIVSDRYQEYDASTIPYANLYISGADCIITNPPFSKDLLLPIMYHLMHSGLPLWLLLPADIMHNKYMTPYMSQCETVVSVGRLCWFPDEVTGKMVKGVDNYQWMEFVSYETPTTFHGRM
tara:strand:- start:397 stop:945 length:549 start_codon:yes stop_codon:yes gene_type:complete